MLETRPFTNPQDFSSVLSLYESVGWGRYTNEPERLSRALEKSFSVDVAITDGEIVGLVRTISDGEVICYIQDLLVRPEYQGQGVGSALLKLVLENNPVRQIVLMTDNESRQRRFYEKSGFRLIAGELNAFAVLR